MSTVFSVIKQILLAVVTFIFVVMAVTGIFDIREQRSYYSEGIMEMKDIYLEALGDKWDGEAAPAGYRYYRAVFEVENVSHFQENENAVWYYFDGEEYSDVEEPYRDQTANLFYYSNLRQIPAGRTTRLESILLIKNGVDEIQVTFECGYDTDEIEEMIAVPQDFSDEAIL